MVRRKFQIGGEEEHDDIGVASPTSHSIPHVSRRNESSASDWCKCENCQQKKQEIECVCCQELQDTKIILEKEQLSK